MSRAGRRHMGAGSQGKGDASGARTILDKDMVGENDILSNRDKSQHRGNRGLDGKGTQTDQRQDHSANREITRNSGGERSDEQVRDAGDAGEA